MATDPRLLSEEGWKAVLQKHRLKDKDLLKALQQHQALDENAFDARIKSCAKLVALATALRREEEIAANAPVAKYLGDLLGAAQTAQRDVARAKAESEAEAKKKQKSDEGEDGEGEEEDDDEDDEDDEQAGAAAYAKKLGIALKNLKAAKEPYHFIFCEAKPVSALAISKRRISPKQLKVLVVVTGGSKRFLKPGTVRREEGTLIFEMEKPPAGLAMKILKSIKFFTDRKFRVRVGTESAEDDTGTTESGEADTTAAGAAAPARPSLEKAPEVWSVTQRVVKARIDQLKSAVRASFAAEGTELVAEIERNMRKLDAVFERLDDELADRLRRAHAARDAAARGAELSSAKALLAEHIKYVKSEPMIAHIDSNPFGVATNLQATLMKSLKHVVQAIGEER